MTSERINVKYHQRKVNPKYVGDSSYYNDINDISHKPLNNKDIDDLKRFSQYYGYYYNKNDRTISMRGKLYTIYRVKNKLYAKNGQDCIQLNKQFKLTKALRASKVEDIVLKRIK